MITPGSERVKISREAISLVLSLPFGRGPKLAAKPNVRRIHPRTLGEGGVTLISKTRVQKNQSPASVQRCRRQTSAPRTSTSAASTGIAMETRNVVPMAATGSACCPALPQVGFPQSRVFNTAGTDTAEMRFFCRAVISILSQRLLHKTTNSRAVFLARIHAC